MNIEYSVYGSFWVDCVFLYHTRGGTSNVQLWQLHNKGQHYTVVIFQFLYTLNNKFYQTMSYNTNSEELSMKIYGNIHECIVTTHDTLFPASSDFRLVGSIIFLDFFFEAYLENLWLLCPVIKEILLKGVFIL